MTLRCSVLFATALAMTGTTTRAQPPQVGKAVVDRVRFYPAPKLAAAMVGGKITGSNVSATSGFTMLAEIKEAPPEGRFTELAFPNDRPYRWVRYEAPAGSHGAVAEVEFYAGPRKLTGTPFGTFAERSLSWFRKAVDGDPKTWFESETADDQSVGYDLLEQATALKPVLAPGPDRFPGPVTVEIQSGTPGATIRYTLDGTTPGADTGRVYTGPLALDKTSTLTAVAVVPGTAPSPPQVGTFVVEPTPSPVVNSLHLGNSLTGTTGRFATYAATAGRRHNYQSFTMGGALTKKLWDVGLVEQKDRWEKTLAALPAIDVLTLQPRDFDLAEEADYDTRFLKLLRQRSPDLQPWLYTEWVEKHRGRPTDLGTLPTRQMKKTYRAGTWEESMSAMLVYAEDLQAKIGETDTDGKPLRVLPTCLAMGWVHNLIQAGKLPGVKPGSFYPLLFADGVHPNANGAYLVDLTWYAALYRESPEGKVLPVGTDFTAEQAAVLQKLAWDVIANYPDCGLYEVGAEPTGAPEFAAAPSAAVMGATAVTLSSTTPGAWFRYTLDGTPPTRTRGCVYCGAVTVRPGATLTAIAYRNGRADSTVAEFRPAGR